MDELDINPLKIVNGKIKLFF